MDITTETEELLCSEADSGIVSALLYLYKYLYRTSHIIIS